ncbi:MAG: glucose-1-phosphate adenylyltransferase [Rhodothermales bacterium]|nr:glucose-1-phosphate adenylyltransferase [Rhodothermales bacterium]
MSDTIAVILGGGAGTRLYPLTRHRSKPAVPLAGKYRLIDVPISNCIHSQIDRIFVLTQFNSASLNRHVGRSYQFDKFREGFVTIIAAEQTPNSKEWFQGTADAVRQSMIHLNSFKHNYLLVLSGDQLYSMDYRKMRAHHIASEAHITIATIPVREEEASGFGILKTDEDSLITEFNEKPPPELLPGLKSPVSDEMKAAGREHLASMGIYIFSHGVLDKLLESRPDAVDFGKQIIPDSISELRVASYAFDGYWSDIGTIRSFYDANLMLAKPKPDFDMFNPQTGLYTNPRMLPPAKIQNATIRDSIVAESSVIIDSIVENCVIGLRSFIGSNTQVRNTIFMGADYYPWHDLNERSTVDGPGIPGVAEGSIVENAIVDRNASIGKNCRITNASGISELNGDDYYIRDGLIVIPKNAVIPDNTVI